LQSAERNRRRILANGAVCGLALKGVIPKPRVFTGGARDLACIATAARIKLRAFRILSWLAFLPIVWMLTNPPRIQGQLPKPSEYAVKAAYLYNFGKFIEWPAGIVQAQSDSFDICVLGDDPFGAALNAAVANEKVVGKRVVAKQIPQPQDAVNCRVLFISLSEERRLKQILASLGTSSVLTVSDLPQFAQRGGMVQFVLEDNKVRFEVNSATAERAGLTLSSELLKLAVNVRRTAQLGD
jgi:hypothetical protein